MGLLKSRSDDIRSGNLTYHGSPHRRTILKAGGQAARIAVAIEMEGNGTGRGHGRDRSGPGRQSSSASTRS
jgi:hypothetical protein